ncbi:MAG: type II toxin-antitoxin system RelE/ParE family toxin [Rhodospirillales bacterium]
MARYRLSHPARADIASILSASETRHGPQGRIRYRGLLAAALRRIAGDPLGRSTRDRGDLFAGLRSLHVRHARGQSRAARVGAPVHVIFYRAAEPGLVEIVRVLHERMEPSRHLGPQSEETEKPGER